MKLIVVSHMYPNKDNKSSGIFVKQQIEEMKEKGIEIYLINPIPFVPFFLRKRGKYNALSKINYYEELDGIKIFHPRVFVIPKGLFFELYGLFFSFSMKKLVNKLIHKYNVDRIHIHTAYPDGYAICKAVNNDKVKKVITIHGQDMAYNIEKNNFLKNEVTWSLKNCNKVICVSNKLKDKAKEFIDESKIEVVNNGINLKEIEQKGKSLLAEDPENKIKILSVGNLIELKGFDYLIKAVDILVNEKGKSNITVYIVGEGTLRHQLEELALNLNVNNHIKFLGAVEHKEVMKAMADCDMFVLPSWKEGFGMVYIEAMSNGKPVIACKNQGISDVIVNESNGLLVNTKDEIDLAYSIERLIIDNELKNKIANNARETVINNFTWEKNVEKMIGVFQRI